MPSAYYRCLLRALQIVTKSAVRSIYKNTELSGERFAANMADYLEKQRANDTADGLEASKGSRCVLRACCVRALDVLRVRSPSGRVCVLILVSVVSRLRLRTLLCPLSS